MSSEPAVWTYWEGPCPDYIALCLDTIRRWCRVTVLDRSAFDALWREDRDLPIDDLYVAHRADFIRAYLLQHYGGVWIDADCVVLRSIAPLAELLAEHDLVAYREPVGGIANNFVIARPARPVIGAFYGRVVEHLRQHRPISWVEIGSAALTAAIAEHPDATRVLPPEQIMPISWTETHRFLEPAASGTAVDPNAYCYMLSNHSMPAAIKAASRADVLSGPTLLAALFRRAMDGHPSGADVGANYRYWSGSGGLWAVEYERRKMRHPYYHVAEMMILDHVAHHAPCRVLEWGCGTGRHLFNLSKLPGVDVFGFDQSESMVREGTGWADPGWRAAHLKIGPPTDPLPFADGEFDIVYTSEALLHTRPDDLCGRLAELIRVCRGHILHMESPPAWSGGYSPSCAGCWGHDFIAAYRDLGLECQPLPGGYSRQTPYVVVLQPESRRWTWSPAMLALYCRMEAQLEEGFARAGVGAHA